MSNDHLEDVAAVDSFKTLRTAAEQTLCSNFHRSPVLSWCFLTQRRESLPIGTNAGQKTNRTQGKAHQTEVFFLEFFHWRLP